MGNCYANIIEIEGIFKDLNIAYQFWTKASEKGHGMAFLRLGDLFGTWEYLDGTYHNISTGEISGISEFIDQDGKAKYYQFNLPENWQHNIPLARKYWEKAVQYGGTTAEIARKRLEKVYWEEQYK